MEWIRAAQQGGRGAFCELVCRHRPGVIRVVYLILMGAAALPLLKHFSRRASVLEERGIGQALTRGYAIGRANGKDIGLRWLVLIGLQLGYAILLIPVTLILLLITGGAGGILGLTTGGVVGLFAGMNGALIAGAIVGMPVCLFLMAAPLALLGGLKKTCLSPSWTLAYREAVALMSPGGEQAQLEEETDRIFDVDYDLEKGDTA